MTIDWRKPVQTRDGRPVELITIKARGVYPVIGYIGNNVAPDNWTAGGKFVDYASGTSPADLINIPEESELWLNVYEKGNSLHISREIADQYQSIGRIACVHVKYRVGEGLE